MAITRWRAALLALIIAALGVVVVSGSNPPRAIAAEPDRWGYALVDTGQIEIETAIVPDVRRQDTSNSADVTAYKSDTGVVDVRFHGLATSTLGAALVTTASDGRECTQARVAISGADVVVTVRCTGILDVTLADAAFTVVYVRSSAPLTGLGRLPTSTLTSQAIRGTSRPFPRPPARPSTSVGSAPGCTACGSTAATSGWGASSTLRQ